MRALDFAEHILKTDSDSQFFSRSWYIKTEQISGILEYQPLSGPLTQPMSCPFTSSLFSTAGIGILQVLLSGNFLILPYLVA